MLRKLGIIPSYRRKPNQITSLGICQFSGETEHKSRVYQKIALDLLSKSHEVAAMLTLKGKLSISHPEVL